MDSNNNNTLEKLILMGIVEVAGLDAKTGEFLYAFSPDLAKTNPELYAEVNRYFGSSIMELWADGFLDLDLNQNGEEIIRLNEKSLDPEAMANLTEQQRAMMAVIIREFDKE